MIFLDTLSEILSSNGAIPITITTTTNWTQMILTLAVSGFFIIFFLWKFFGTTFVSLVNKFQLLSIKKITGRNIILIKHTHNELFNTSMINQDTLLKIGKAINKFNGKPFDLILHTPGGEVFAATYLSRLLKKYPGEIRAIVPIYAMSGGSLLALSSKKIFMGETSCIGPIDPQLGNLFKYGSAKSYNKIVKFKGKKADDQTISFAFMGKQYSDSMKDLLKNSLDLNMDKKQKDNLIKLLVSGDVEHAYQLTPQHLSNFGIKVNKIPPSLNKKLIKIISNEGAEGVTFI